MSLRHLCDQFHAWRQEGREMVLATVIATAGSTYSKAGAQMLIADGQFHRGLLSGGCLEGDLMLRARTCLDDGRARRVSYDMRDRTEDEIWGLGLGCDGALDILLQPLQAASGWEPFAAIARTVAAGTPGALALIVDVDGEEASSWLGTACVVTQGTAASRPAGSGEAADATLALLAQRCREALASNTGERTQVRAGDGALLDVLITPIALPVRLLVLGAGPDTVPLLRMARELGWYVTQADHRPASLATAAAQAPVDASIEAAPGRLHETLAVDDFDAVIVMTHHLASDRAHLVELAGSHIPFIGLLGPAARRRRLLADVTRELSGDQGSPALAGGPHGGLAARTHGPVGLDLGARDPAGIALSILAQVQQFLARHR
jgi:xanthine/CO dehydrogenase XdhC/CoxF family maturation factor